MELVNKKPTQLIFKTKIDESLANAIRRHINKIPINAVVEVEISKNDSPLFDETIAHRIGLIPLKTDKVDEKKTVKIKLDSKKEGPVYSGELKGPIKSVYDQIPITNLTKGQELEISATVRTGKGEDHAKFSPGLIFYRNVVEVKIKDDCPQDILESCPKEILNSKDKKIIVDDPSVSDLIEICSENCKKRGKDSIEIRPTDEIVMTIESFGQLDTEEIFRKSIDCLKRDLSEVSKKLEKA